MGWISSTTLFLAVSINDESIFFPVRTPSVSFKRRGMGATLPSARRTSRIVPFAIWDVRLALGSVAPIPLRLNETEGVLTGKKIDSSLIETAKKSVVEEIQ